jgi:hypothetical protein
MATTRAGRGAVRRVVVAAAGMALLACAGCGAGVRPVPVQGTITLDGAPLAGVQILFDPMVEPGRLSPPRSRTVSDDQGRYVLRCDTGEDGAVPGRHRVTVMYATSAHDQEAGIRAGKARVPANYSSATQTPLQVEVVAGQANYDLKLTAKR